MSKAHLFVNDKIYTGWKKVRVQRSLDQIAGTFTVGFQTKKNWRQPWKASYPDIQTGDAVEVHLHMNKALVGWVDKVDAKYDENQISFSCSGRDVTGDLVDCSAVAGVPPQVGDAVSLGTDFIGRTQFKDQTLDQIIEYLILYYGNQNVAGQESIDVLVAQDIRDEIAERPFENVKINLGDSVFDSIAKLCKQRAVLPVTLGDGRLLLTRAGSSKAIDSLVYGENVLTGSISHSFINRFNQYIVLSQGEGTETKQSSDYIGPYGLAYDQSVGRFKPLIILSENQSDSGRLIEYAQREAAQRAGKSMVLTYSVKGWKQRHQNPEARYLWKLNELVRVKDKRFNIDGEYLIAGITYDLIEGKGEITTMKIVDPITYQLIEDIAEEIQTAGFDSAAIPTE